MPLLRRGSLARLGGTPSVPEAVTWFRELAGALRFAHGKGVLHCDLKPSNILIDEEGHLRLVDFGQSRRSGEASALGTLGYMPPEQAAPGSESPGSTPNVGWDLYALGATVYWLLTGQVPRLSARDQEELSGRSSLSEYRQRLTANPLIPVRRLNPAVDGELAAILEACLELDPARRPESAGQVLLDLAARERHEPLLCRRPWSAGYRAGLLLRKGTVRLALASLLVLASLLGYHVVEIGQRNRQLQEQMKDLRLKSAHLSLTQGLMEAEAGHRDRARASWERALKDVDFPDDRADSLRAHVQVLLRTCSTWEPDWDCQLPAPPAPALRDETFALSPDGAYLAIALEDGRVAVVGGKELGEIPFRASLVRFVGPRRLATASREGTLQVWDLPALTAGSPAMELGAPALDLSADPEGRLVVVAGSGELRRLDASMRDAVAPLRVVPARASSARLDAAGKRLLVEGSQGFRWWNLEGGTWERVGPTRWKSSEVSLSADGLHWGILNRTPADDFQLWQPGSSLPMDFFSHLAMSRDGARLAGVSLHAVEVFAGRAREVSFPGGDAEA
ncbi:MAG: serine/threonine-protein kinase, partial [Candidatus Eremiobacterota bacterium]